MRKTGLARMVLLCAWLAACGGTNAATVFNFEQTPAVTMETFANYTDWGPVSFTNFNNHLATNGFFWANENLGNTIAEYDIYHMAKMDYTAGGTALTVRGASFHGDYITYTYYSTYGTAISRNVGNDVQGWAFNSLKDTTSVYNRNLPGQANTFLLMYDGWGVGDAKADAYFVPGIEFSQSVKIQSLDIANTLYVANALSVDNGFNDPFTYADNSYLGLTITGLNATGVNSELTFLLADFYTYANDTEAVDTGLHSLTWHEATGTPGVDVEYLSLANGILDQWATLDLSSLGSVTGLEFTMFTSDVGEYGANTPNYWAIDNITLAGGEVTPPGPGGTGVPEPATWVMLLTAAVWLAWRNGAHKMKMNKKSSQTSGFTLVEMLVVIAIIGVLLSLLLPAVNSAREAARRTICQNNLKQMGIALNAFNTQNGKFPWGGYMHPNVYVNGVKVDGTKARGFAWSVYILPELEQQGLYDRIDFDMMYSMGVNNDVAQTRLEMFVCPSAKKTEPEEALVYVASGSAIRTQKATYGLSHYGGIYGERIAWPGRTTSIPNNPPRGTLLYDRQITARDIRDGLTNTLMVGEDSTWADGQWISSLNVMDQCGGINDRSITENEIRSDHSGGASAVFADGHVDFLANQMSLEVLAAICTRAGGEIIPSEE